MGIEELKALRKRYKEEIREKDKYGAIRVGESIKKLPKFRTQKEIIEHDKTTKAKNNIKTELESIVLALEEGRISYEQININLKLSFFINKRVIEQESNFLLKWFDLNDILDNYVSFTHEYSVIQRFGNGEVFHVSGAYPVARMINHLKIWHGEEEYIVKYNEFISMLNEFGCSVVVRDNDNGIDIKSPSFDEIKPMIAARQSVNLTIELDFREKERNQVKK